MINYFKSIIYTLIIIIASTVIITILNYFYILNGILLKIIILLIPIIGVFIGSLLIGKRSNQKGYIEGLKYSVIWIILFTLINLITKNFTITSIPYYIILMLTSIFAGIIGINKKIKG